MKGFFRGTAAYLLATALFFMLFILAYFLVFYQVTANPARVKQALKDSGVYERIPAVIYDNSVDSNSTTSASIPLKSPVVRQAAIDTFNPVFVQKSAENLIDGTYGWLDGQTNAPQFTIDLKAAKDNFARVLSERLGKLPKCSAEQQAKIKKFDAFSSTCLPAGIDVAAAKKEVVKETANSDNFLKETKIDASTFKDSDGKPVFDNYSEVPKTYQAALRIPYIAGAICLLLGAGVVYASKTRREGLKKLSKLLVISGFFVALVPIAVSHLIENILKSSADDKIASELIGPVVSELSRTTSKVYFAVGAIYVLLAVAVFVLLDKIKPAKPVKKQGK